jgi:hypothetical protein
MAALVHRSRLLAVAPRLRRRSVRGPARAKDPSAAIEGADQMALRSFDRPDLSFP